jgi:hypothetical protein
VRTILEIGHILTILGPQKSKLKWCQKSDKQAIFDTTKILIQEHRCHGQSTAKAIFHGRRVILNVLLMTTVKTMYTSQ